MLLVFYFSYNNNPMDNFTFATMIGNSPSGFSLLRHACEPNAKSLCVKNDSMTVKS